MNNALLKRLNPTQSIIESLPTIIEAFITFYGEEERENIQSKLNNLVIIGYTNSTKSIVSKLKNSNSITKEESQMIDSYEKKVEKINKTKRKLENKYKKLLLNDLKDLFTKEEFEKLDSQYSLDEDDVFGFIQAEMNNKAENNKVTNFFWNNLSKGYIDAFSKKSEELLNDLNTYSRIKKSIKNDRVTYFKNLGINLGDNYDDYLNYPGIENYIPSIKTAERVISTCQKRQLEMKKEYYSFLPEFQENRQRINNYELLNKEDGYDESIYELNRCCIIPNLKQMGNKYVPFPILCFPTESHGGNIDASLIHELNHVLELQFQGMNGNKCSFICGWDYIEFEVKNKQEELKNLDNNKKLRGYELINEVINELITQEITRILFNNDGYVFDIKEEAKCDSASTYDVLRVIVGEFYETYKKEILESRKNGNIQIILDAVGSENFEKLNQLIYTFKKSFPGYETIDKLLFDIEKVLDKTKKQEYEDIMYSKQQILASMDNWNTNNRIKM